MTIKCLTRKIQHAIIWYLNRNLRCSKIVLPLAYWGTLVFLEKPMGMIGSLMTWHVTTFSLWRNDSSWGKRLVSQVQDGFDKGVALEKYGF
jgi:hypothetical protein